MKNKKIISFLIILFSLTLIVNNVKAEPIKFKPSVPIPGTIVQGEITSSSIGDYINALYIYAARIASILAIFMLVIAAWQWLFAAGSPDKISNAKSTITGALMGLALLFGGHLLLSQINSGLVELKPIDIKKIAEMGICTSMEAEKNICGEGENGLFYLPGPPDDTGNEMTTKCRATGCGSSTEACVYIDPNDAVKDCTYDMIEGTYNCFCVDICSGVGGCDSYKTVSSCRQNTCYGINGVTDVCGTELDSSACTTLDGIDCGDKFSLCTDIGIDSEEVEYCCNKNNTFYKDECKPRIGADQCWN